MNVTFTIHNDRKSLHFAGNFSSELRPFSKYAKEISDIEDNTKFNESLFSTRWESVNRDKQTKNKS